MRLFKWIDTTSTEAQTCKHFWTGFCEPVTLKPLYKFLCMECGKEVEVDRGYCRNGELLVRVEDFEAYELATIWIRNQLSKTKIRNTNVFVLNATYLYIEKCWGPTTAYKFQKEMNKLLGFKIT